MDLIQVVCKAEDALAIASSGKLDSGLCIDLRVFAYKQPTSL
jgi:hypothetical protein